MNRRQFLATSAAAASGLYASPAKPALQLQARPFPLQDVRLTEGPLVALMERNRQYLHALESDRLLHTFRLTAGLPSTAEPLGGWEGLQVELRGHFLGHYLSGCAMMSVSARDEEIKRKAAAIVGELAKCQKANGGGYLSAFPPEFFVRLKETGKVWAPWYTIHKILAGLFDLYTFTGNQQALDVLQGMAGWTAKWADPISDA
ncbi:MAG TPA: beta-L-arabinofuranosidase domain-containing protein, partial [Bryobacteraceae bacterium]